jgi:hypothetical protein
MGLHLLQFLDVAGHQVPSSGFLRPIMTNPTPLAIANTPPTMGGSGMVFFYFVSASSLLM